MPLYFSFQAKLYLWLSELFADVRQGRFHCLSKQQPRVLNCSSIRAFPADDPKLTLKQTTASQIQWKSYFFYLQLLFMYIKTYISSLYSGFSFPALPCLLPSRALLLQYYSPQYFYCQSHIFLEAVFPEHCLAAETLQTPVLSRALFQRP